METSTKTGMILGQLRRACEEMARGFEQMESGEATSDAWAEAVSALSETLAVARVQWVESTLVRREPAAPPPNEYAFHFFARSGEELAGASIQAESDEAAEDELREMAGLDPILNHESASRVQLVHKVSGRAWEIPLE
jgi:hypothetical protein